MNRLYRIFPLISSEKKHISLMRSVYNAMENEEMKVVARAIKCETDSRVVEWILMDALY